MIRATLDTNILLRMAAGGARSHLNQLWHAQQFDLLMSLATLTEFRTVAAYPQVQQYVSPSITRAFDDLLMARAVLVQPDLTAPTCRDPQDTALIATAVGGQADFLVTTDGDLLDDPNLMDALTQRHVKVVRTAEFIASITRRNS
jgi:uncharacterized protein